MWSISTEKSWYAIFVVSGKEEDVKSKLQEKFKNELKFIVPKRKLNERKDGQWRIVERILFPGYILVKGQITVENYHDMRDTLGIIKLLRSDEGPLRIQDEEIQVLALLIGESSGEIGLSKVLEKGEKVKVIDGPLIGLEGIIIKIDKRKGREL